MCHPLVSTASPVRDQDSVNLVMSKKVKARQKQLITGKILPMNAMIFLYTFENNFLGLVTYFFFYELTNKPKILMM